MPGRRVAAASVLTVLAAALLLGVLVVPNRLEDLEPAGFLRLPVEAIGYVAIVLVLPARLARARTGLALLFGVVLAVTAVFKLLDMGFFEALNRPFDPLIDWRYASDLVETVRGSVSGRLGVVLLLGAAAAVVALLVLVPLSVLRVTRSAVRHRRRAAQVVTGLAALWLVLLGAEAHSGAGAVASHDTSAYVAHQVTRIPSELRDQREFARAAEHDPYRSVSGDELLTALRGKDVLLIFVESYGRVAVQGSAFSPRVNAVLTAGTRRLDSAGLHSRSAYLTSPTFGALSWLAHSTLQSGLWVDSQQRYDQLVTSRRLTLTGLFGRAGWRTVADVPANNRDWPQGEFYRFDQIYDSRNVGYQGPRFGYPTMPDQYTLDAFHRMELAPRHRRPVMAEIDLITSHAPWSRTPRIIDQSAVGDGSVYDGMPEQLPSEGDIWPAPRRVRAAYATSIEYSLSAVVSFLTTYGDDDLVVVMLGDHQPATIVSGPDAGHDVPVSIIAGDPAVLQRVSSWGWAPGLRPAPRGPVWRMDRFRDRFLAAYGPNDDTGPRPVGTR